jgi:hypothetical protein
MSPSVFAPLRLDNTAIVVGFRLESVRSEFCILRASTFEELIVEGFELKSKCMGQNTKQISRETRFCSPADLTCPVQSSVKQCR